MRGVAHEDEYEQWWARARRNTTIVINLANVLERMDEQVLPAVYKSLGAAYHASPSQLGYLTLCRALTQAMAAPLGGFAGMREVVLFWDLMLLWRVCVALSCAGV